MKTMFDFRSLKSKTSGNRSSSMTDFMVQENLSHPLNNKTNSEREN